MAMTRIQHSRVFRGAAGVAAIAVAIGLGLMAPASAQSRTVMPLRLAANVGISAGGQAQAQLMQGRSGAVRYAVTKALCDAPSPAQLSCDAIKLVPSKKGALGAKAYVSSSYTKGPKGGFTPADLASAYGFNPTTAVNQTVAIVDAYDNPKALADLNTFDAHYGLPKETATSFRKLNQAGTASPLPAPNTGWAGEIALDIETVRAVCNKCKIVLVEATTPTSANLATAVNTAARLKATEISNSYGGSEVGATATTAKAYDHPGIVITASTGDHGWYGWDSANSAGGFSDNVPSTPAAFPTVVSVAGTALALNTNGTRKEEDVWNENGPDDNVGLQFGASGASGGGCSTTYAAPSFQSKVAGYAATGCGTKRLAGDVAALADPYTGFDIYSTYGGTGWATFGGTSLSSPLVAAMWALAGGAHGAKYPAQSLYDNFRLRASSINDVKLGGNAFCAGDTAANCSATVKKLTTNATGNPNNLGNGNAHYQNGWAGLLDCGYAYDGSEKITANNKQCVARTGYDGSSGVGSPKGVSMFKPTHPTIAITLPAILKLGSKLTWKATSFKDPVSGGKATKYSWAWGDGTAATASTSASATHTFTKAGTYKVTLTVTDNHAQKGTKSVTITVGAKPTAVLTGPTTIKINTTGHWTSATSSTKNTGASIATWAWTINAAKAGSQSSLAHKFTTLGKRTMAVAVTDTSGQRATKTITVNVTK